MPEEKTPVVETPESGGEALSGTQSEFNTESALADISSDLFGQEGEGDGGVPAEGAEATAAPAPSGESAESSPLENSEEVQAAGAPETWTKEALAEWAGIPDRAKEEILKREEDMHRGLEEYKGRALVGDRYAEAVKPYAPVLEKMQIDPVEMFQNFAGNHYLLSFGTPQQKLELAANLLQNYNIDIIEVAGVMGNMPALDPKARALEIENDRLRKAMNERNNTDLSAARNRISTEIEAFASDPKNIYFDELSNDIAKLLETGVASTLQEAYEKATFANPATRKKEVERLTAERRASDLVAEKTRKDAIAKSTAADVNTRPNNRDGTIPLGSMDDTLEETLAAIRARG